MFQIQNVPKSWIGCIRIPHVSNWNDPLPYRDASDVTRVILQLAYIFSAGVRSLQYMFPVSPLIDIKFATYNI